MHEAGVDLGAHVWEGLNANTAPASVEFAWRRNVALAFAPGERET